MIGAQKIFKTLEGQVDQFLISKIQGVDGSYFGPQFPDKYSFSISDAKYYVTQQNIAPVTVMLVWWEDADAWAIYIPASAISANATYGTGRLIIPSGELYERLEIDFDIVHIEGYYPPASAINALLTSQDLDNGLTSNLEKNHIATESFVTNATSPLLKLTDLEAITTTLEELSTSVSAIDVPTTAEIIAAILADPVLFRVLKIWAYGSTSGLINGAGPWTVTYENDTITGTRDANGNDSNVTITIVLE